MAGSLNNDNDKFGILWLDSDVNNGEHNLLAQQQFYDRFDNVEIFENENLCQEFIQSHSKKLTILIVSGRLSRKIIPTIHSLQHLSAIYIYCMDKSKHEEWARQFSKIKGIIVDLEQLMSQIQSDLRTMSKKTKPIEHSSSTSSLPNLFPQPVPNSIDDLTNSLQATGISETVKNKSSHLDGYEKMPLVTLEDAVVPLKNILDDVEQMVWTVKQNAENPEEGLTSDESAAIALYTMEWYPKEKSFYYNLNEALKSEDKQQIKPWFSYLRLVFKASSKLKTVSHIVYNGINENRSYDYPKGKTFISWEFLTCTSSIRTLESDEYFGKSGQRTLFTIECRSGKDISRHAFDQSKEQVLLLPGRQFKVISCLSPDDELNIIQLEETSQLYTFQ